MPTARAARTGPRTGAQVILTSSSLITSCWVRWALSSDQLAGNGKYWLYTASCDGWRCSESLTCETRLGCDPPPPNDSMCCHYALYCMTKRCDFMGSLSHASTYPVEFPIQSSCPLTRNWSLAPTLRIGCDEARFPSWVSYVLYWPYILWTWITTIWNSDLRKKKKRMRKRISNKNR